MRATQSCSLLRLTKGTAVPSGKAGMETHGKLFWEGKDLKQPRKRRYEWCGVREKVMRGQGLLSRGNK